MSEPPRSADMLVEDLLEPGVLTEVNADPKKVLTRMAEKVTRRLPPPAFVTDAMTYRIVVVALGAVSVLAAGGAIALGIIAKGANANIPDVVTALGSAAIGALAGLLAPSPRSA